MRRAAAALSLIVVAVACGPKTPGPRGELMLAIDTDMAAGADFDRFEIEIRQQGVDPVTRVFREFGQPGQEAHFPATFALVANDAPETSLQLRIFTGKSGSGGNPDVGQPQNLFEAVTTIPSDRTAVLRVHLDWLCRASAKLETDLYVEGNCPEGTTCVAGTCRDWAVNTAALPTFTEQDVFGGGTSRGDGQCFDTLACFDGGHTVALDADCTFPFNGDSLHLNVALAPPSGRGGICAGATCLVPLDADTEGGFHASGGRVRIPPKVCELLNASPKGLRGVVVSESCGAKTPSVPTCGPWSAITTQRGTTTTPSIAGL